MDENGRDRARRTRVFFFLILAAAVLWAVFLLQRKEYLLFSFMFAGLACINPVVAFVEIRDPSEARSLFFFYILVLAALLWAVFLLLLGIHLWVSLFLFLVAIGIPAILHVTGKHGPQVTGS
jgi:heme O synthase-like polyprenyltransferase